MNKGWIAVLAATLALHAWIYADAAAPLVQFPTADAAWTVEFTETHASPPSPPSAPDQKAPVPKKARRAEVTRVGNVQRTRIIWTDGQTSEYWTVPGVSMVFKEYPNGAVFPLSNSKVEVKADTFDHPSDASAFGWITPARLQEKNPVNVQGKSCYHYAGEVPEPTMGGVGESGAKRGTAKWEAWIDSRTLLPVVLETGTSHCVFTFLPPAEPLEMPPKFKEAISRYKHVMGLP